MYYLIAFVNALSSYDAMLRTFQMALVLLKREVIGVIRLCRHRNTVNDSVSISHKLERSVNIIILR